MFVSGGFKRVKTATLSFKLNYAASPPARGSGCAPVRRGMQSARTDPHPCSPPRARAGAARALPPQLTALTQPQPQAGAHARQAARARAY